MKNLFRRHPERSTERGVKGPQHFVFACHSEPQAKNPRICSTTSAVIPSAAAKRRSRGTPAFAFVLLSALSASSTQIAAAQSDALTPANTAQPAKPFSFEVVSIRPHKPGAERMGTQYLPNGYNVNGASIAYLIQLAYMPKDGIFSSSRIEHEPPWLNSDLFDVEARVALEDQAAWQKAQTGISSDLLQRSLQAALKDRCKLAAHITYDQAPGFNLVVAKHGARLKPTVPGAVKPVPRKTYTAGDGFYIQDNGTRQFVGVSMADFARVVTRLTGNQIVSDKTGLAGRYDFRLPWYDESPQVRGVDQMPLSSVGLALKPGKVTITVINIDHIEKPDAN